MIQKCHYYCAMSSTQSENKTGTPEVIPRSSVVLLFLVFGALGFVLQMILLSLGSETNYITFETFYNPVIDWMLHGFPRDGENTSIGLAFLMIGYSILLSLFCLTIMFAIRAIKHR